MNTLYATRRLGGYGWHPTLWLYKIQPERRVVGREGFEPSKAMPADLQSAPVDRLGTDPWIPPMIQDILWKNILDHERDGATDRN